MQLPFASKIHLTYCSNVHTARNLTELLSNIRSFGPGLRDRLAFDGPLGLGLHISAEPARELVLGQRMSELQEALAEHNLYVYTLNGFPYGDFQGGRIKSAVFAPDWRDNRRLDYTLLLTRILAGILPSDVEGGISTVPISMKEWVRHASSITLAENNLLAWVEAAIDLFEQTGQTLHLDIEPEPAGWLETSDEIIHWFETAFLIHGARLLGHRRGMGRFAAEDAIRKHLRICYDACQLTVRFEEPREVLAKFASAAIHVGKLQISSALRVMLPPGIELRQEIARQLATFAEPIYLHQVVERAADGSINYLGDLETVLPNLSKTTAREWRINYHVPLISNAYGILQSTQRETATAVYEALKYDITHWEIETYTWNILPIEQRGALLDQLAAEYQWVMGRVAQFVGAPQRRAA